VVDSVGQEQAWRVVFSEWVPDYFSCSIRHNILVDWEKQIQEQRAKAEKSKKRFAWPF